MYVATITITVVVEASSKEDAEEKAHDITASLPFYVNDVEIAEIDLTPES